NSYHGSTQVALTLIGDDAFHQAYAPLLPGISFIEFNNFDDIARITEQTAGLFLESIQGEAGVQVPHLDWIKAVRKRCDETGTLPGLDEIQTGVGRTGKLFAFEDVGIKAD